MKHRPHCLAFLLAHNAGEVFSWARFLPDVERDVEIAKGTVKPDDRVRPAR